MKIYEKVLIGGLGALMPVILNLLVVDFETLHDGVTPLRILGYLIRVAVLFGLGGFVAYLHKTERQAFKVFQLGLGAPAVLVGMLNGINSQHASEAASKKAEAAVQPWFGLEAVAEAQEAPVQEKVRSFEDAKPSALGEFWQGFLGQRPNRPWFVISGSHLSREAAQQQVEVINSTGKGLKAEVYEPYGGSKYYAVVIGAGLTKPEALLLQQRAFQAKLPKDTFLWTFPKE